MTTSRERGENITALVQARMGSTRLPGKTLADIEGKPLLQHILERVQACRRLRHIVLATSTLEEDDPVADLAHRCGTEVFRGSAEDVLDRFYRAARQFTVDIVVRITADDPFKDPDVIDRAIEEYLRLAPHIDYVSNTLEPSYPEGLDIEVVSTAALELAWREAKHSSEREHVTPYIYSHPERFRIAQFRAPEDHSRLRWTIDYPEDLAFARAVYARLDRGGLFRMQDILDLLRVHPEVGAINAGHIRNEGYLKSLAIEPAGGRDGA